MAIGLTGIQARTQIEDNLLWAAFGIGTLPGKYDAVAEHEASREELPNYLITLGLNAEDNWLACEYRGIGLASYAIHLGETHLARNSIWGCRQVGILDRSAVLGQVVTGSRLDICKNLLQVRGTGIVVGADDARIYDNDIRSPVPDQGQDAIVLSDGFSTGRWTAARS